MINSAEHRAVTSYRTRPAFSVCFGAAAVLALAGCSKPDPAASSQPEVARAQLDACALLTREEVAAIQGAAVQDAKPLQRVEQGVAISQCYFTLLQAADSINVVVTQPLDSASPRHPREAWKLTFLDDKPPKIGRDGKEKRQPSPEKIADLGDDAYWAGGRFGGTLHMLKGDTSVLISVGGPGDEAVKRENLKALGKKILERL